MFPLSESIKTFLLCDKGVFCYKGVCHCLICLLSCCCLGESSVSTAWEALGGLSPGCGVGWASALNEANLQCEPENEGRAAHQPQKVRTENLKLRTAMQGLYMTMMTFRLSNVSISFPTIHTHTQVSGWRQAPSCKLWLQTIKNYARDCFQAFAHCRLEWLSCLIGIWADALFRTGHQFGPAVLHRIWFMTCGFVPVPYFCSETNVW